MAGHTRRKQSATTRSNSRVSTSQQVDPRLKYNATQSGTIDPERDHSATQKLPIRPDGSWDGAKILSLWSQLDQSASSTTGPMRCSANATMAAAIMKGPKSVAALASKVGRLGTNKLSRVAKKHVIGLIVDSALCTSLGPFLKDGTATYGHLSSIANVLKIVDSKNADGAATFKEADKMGSRVGKTVSVDKQVKSRSELTKYVDKLASGETYTVHVDMNATQQGHKPKSKDGDHFITLGEDNQGTWIYDPWPRKGSQMLRTTDEGFWPTFENKSGQMKWVSVVHKITPNAG